MVVSIVPICHIDSLSICLFSASCRKKLLCYVSSDCRKKLLYYVSSEYHDDRELHNVAEASNLAVVVVGTSSPPPPPRQGGKIAYHFDQRDRTARQGLCAYGLKLLHLEARHAQQDAAERPIGSVLGPPRVCCHHTCCALAPSSDVVPCCGSERGYSMCRLFIDSAEPLSDYQLLSNNN